MEPTETSCAIPGHRQGELLINARADGMGFFSCRLEDVPLMAGVLLAISEQFFCCPGGACGVTPGIERIR